MTYIKCTKIRAKPLFAAVVLALLTICIETFYTDFKQVFAQDTEQSVGCIKRIKNFTSHSSSPYHKINEPIESENEAEVNRLLEECESNPEITVADRVSLAQAHGQTCYALYDYNCALTQFKKIIALREDIHEGLYLQTLYLVTQISFSLENYPDALLYAQSLFDTQTDPSSEDFILLSQAYYQLEKYDKALPYALSGIQKTSDFENVPTERALSLLSDIYRKTDQFEKMLPVLDQLIEHYPNEIYWRAQREAHRELSYKQAN